MEKLIDLARDINFSVLNGVSQDIYKELHQKVGRLIKIAQSDPAAILYIDGNGGFQLGQAFDVSFSSFNNWNCNDAKFVYYCCIICYCKAIAMGTMQSAIAAHKLYLLLENNCQLVEPIILGMTNEYMEEQFNMPKDEFSPNVDTKKKIEWRFSRLKYFLVQITRAQDAFKNADIKACKVGNLYLQALQNEAKVKIEGYMFLGII